jgi:hypothetical protein
MNRFVLAAGLLAAVAGLCAHAQTIDLQANIPFEFRMGETIMPAGEYRIQSSSAVLVVRGEVGHRPVAQVVAIPASRPATQKPGRLEFNRYGNSYFLTRAWDPYSEGGRALMKTPQEKELASRNGFVQTASVPFRRR